MHLLALAFLCLLGLTSSVAFAAEIVPGLAYLRPGADVAPVKGSAIIDLRALTNEAVAAPLLAAVEPGETNPRRVVLVLLSPDTPESLRNQIAGRARWLTLARENPRFRSDILVAAAPETEKRALDALAAGSAPEKLISENADKPRFDESSLVREHAGEPDQSTSVSDAPSEDDKTAQTPVSAKPPAAPVDAVLQRAVQVYRGLVTLKRAD